MDPNRLKAIPLFSHLSDEEANRLAAFATETSAAEGQILMKQGDYAVELIAIEEGTADIIQDGKKVASLGPVQPRAAQRRRDRDVADAPAQAHTLGDPPDVRRDRGADQGGRRPARPGGAVRPRQLAARG